MVKHFYKSRDYQKVDGESTVTFISQLEKKCNQLQINGVQLMKSVVEYTYQDKKRWRKFVMKTLNKTLIKGVSSITTNEEMSALIELVKHQQRLIRTLNARQSRTMFGIGDNVLVEARNRVPMKGIIEKINRTKAIVLMNGSRYNVPFSIMKAA